MSDLIPRLKTATKLEIRKSKIGGYGVFAQKAIAKGEVIEEAVMSRTSYRSKDLMHQELRQLCYTYPCKCEDCRVRGTYLLISSGFINVYNHNLENPDVRFDYNLKARFIRVTAKKAIRKGKEIFHSYGSSYPKNPENMKEVHA